MRFTLVILSAFLCLQASAESDIDSRSDDAIVAAAEQLIAQGDVVEGKVEELKIDGEVISKTITDPKVENIKDLKESEIPVVLSAKKIEKAESNLALRMGLSLGILILVAGGLVYASKRWGRAKDKGGNKARIEVLHQHHLGPKRSLAIVRVSGEAVLVGITDTSINLLKTVTLIDDELDHVMNKDFNGFLEDEFSIEDVRHALSGPRMER